MPPKRSSLDCNIKRSLCLCHRPLVSLISLDVCSQIPLPKMHLPWTVCFVVNFARFIVDFNDERFFNELAESHRCPFCFGTSACELFYQNGIKIDYHPLVDRYFNSKKIYYGSLVETGENVVLKKLASDEEFGLLDDLIEEYEKLFFRVSPEGLTVDADVLLMNINDILAPSFTDPNAKLRVCPKTAKFHQHFVRKDFSENLGHFSLVHLWTILKINPEAFLLKILPSERGWPVPKLHGSCGRLIIVENAGSSLSNFYKNSWLERAKIAASLLEAAAKLTFKYPHFAIYLTDISPDNIAVSNMHIKFVDLENAIIVERENVEGDRIHASVALKSSSGENWFGFSPRDICLHDVSDHNFFSICQILWQRDGENVYGQDFLHGVPAGVLHRFPELSDALRQCSVPDKPSGHRNLVAAKLENILRAVISHFQNNPHSIQSNNII